MIFSILLLVIFSVLFWLKRKCAGKIKRIFPGPNGLPLFGNVLQLPPVPHTKLSKWADQYGPIYEISLGTARAVVLSDMKSIKNVLGQFNSTGAFNTDTVLLISRGPYGLISSEGKPWAEQRKFCIKNLKTFGFGYQCLQPLIVSEANELLKWINEKMRQSNGEGISILKTLKNVANNTLWTLINGKRIETDNAKLNALMDKFEVGFQQTIQSGLVFLPWLKHIAPNASGHNALDEATYGMSAFVKRQISEHRKTYVGGVTRDLIDCYIEKLEETIDPNSNFFGTLGENNCVASIVELFTAGRETTSHTIHYALIYLCIHSTVQEKLYREISNVIGQKEPTLDDQFKMPYTDAVILETLRHSSITPMGVMQKAIGDIYYEGRKIPKGFLLIANLYHLHHSKSTWNDPENFRPERFLLPGNQKLRDNMAPFQAGRRACAGEPLARDVIFIFIVKVIQTYRIKRHEHVSDEEYLKAEAGFIRRSSPNKMYFERRASVIKA